MQSHSCVNIPSVDEDVIAENSGIDSGFSDEPVTEDG